MLQTQKTKHAGTGCERVLEICKGQVNTNINHKVTLTSAHSFVGQPRHNFDQRFRCAANGGQIAIVRGITKLQRKDRLRQLRMRQQARKRLVPAPTLAEEGCPAAHCHICSHDHARIHEQPHQKTTTKANLRITKRSSHGATFIGARFQNVSAINS